MKTNQTFPLILSSSFPPPPPPPPPGAHPLLRRSAASSWLLPGVLCHPHWWVAHQESDLSKHKITPSALHTKRTQKVGFASVALGALLIHLWGVLKDHPLGMTHPLCAVDTSRCSKRKTYRSKHSFYLEATTANSPEQEFSEDPGKKRSLEWPGWTQTSKTQSGESYLGCQGRKTLKSISKLYIHKNNILQAAFIPYQMLVLKRLSAGNINGKHNSRESMTQESSLGLLNALNEMSIKYLAGSGPKILQVLRVMNLTMKIKYLLQEASCSIQHCYSTGVWTWERLQGSGNAHAVPTLVETLSNSSPRSPHLNCFHSSHNYFVLHVRKIFKYFCEFFSSLVSAWLIKAKGFGVEIIFVCFL